jgi:hypothetical protein
MDDDIHDESLDVYAIGIGMKSLTPVEKQSYPEADMHITMACMVMKSE